jgi:hypothetical protein
LSRIEMGSRSCFTTARRAVTHKPIALPEGSRHRHDCVAPTRGETCHRRSRGEIALCRRDGRDRLRVPSLVTALRIISARAVAPWWAVNIAAMVGSRRHGLQLQRPTNCATCSPLVHHRVSRADALVRLHTLHMASCAVLAIVDIGESRPNVTG